ncbi:hypothetical protein IVB38_34580 [Bradyrhizobium sp. 38]|uniref:hypothetical protein n=1 Tax=unclassified Bradyrhizobium TaxID=2631580 RepID=UPI001FFB5B1E|nr:MULTISPECIES: hypothetical protein [unclassified Bradyrhizobium]MCK1341007.1 hypothetical protein [Bradyrhizobium sp. 38]MCK1780984.1 hypothetical protein [Bradyrhizobium sp. 132]
MLAPSDRNALVNDTAPWSEGDNEALAAFYAMSPRPALDEISRILGRSGRAIQARASRPQLAQRTERGQMRACIVGCGRAFYSTHRFDRYCPMCRHSELVRCA